MTSWYRVAANSLLLALAGGGCSKSGRAPAETDAPRIWLIDNTRSIGAQTPTVLGAPTVTPLAIGPALCFDGSDDGLVFEKNPLEGRSAFTVEVLFRSDSAGPSAQRFVHIQETGSDNRALIETRAEADGFYLDTFLASNGNKVTLADAKLRHPTAAFHWAALSYADGTMRQYLDGIEELSGSLPFAPLGAGRMALGVRLNRQYWFKGCIRELRIAPRALAASELQKITPP